MTNFDLFTEFYLCHRLCSPRCGPHRRVIRGPYRSKISRARKPSAFVLESLDMEVVISLANAFSIRTIIRRESHWQSRVLRNDQR
jgi:hypothetical protein